MPTSGVSLIGADASAISRDTTPAVRTGSRRAGTRGGARTVRRRLAPAVLLVFALVGLVAVRAGATGTVAGSGAVHLENVAARVGLDFRQGAFRFHVSPDPQAMTGGGLCWLDFDNDGWIDL